MANKMRLPYDLQKLKRCGSSEKLWSSNSGKRVLRSASPSNAERRDIRSFTMWPFSQRDLNGKSGRCCAFGNGYHTIGGHVAATLGAAAHGSPRARVWRHSVRPQAEKTLSRGETLSQNFNTAFRSQYTFPPSKKQCPSAKLVKYAY